MNAPMRKTYSERHDHFDQLWQSTRQLDRRLTIARFAIFVVGSACFLLGVVQAPLPALWYTAGTASVIAFLLVAARHERLADERHEYAVMRKTFAEAIARVDRDWPQMPSLDVEGDAADQAIAFDLDLFGKASLYRLVCQAGTPRGQELLSDWLAHGATPDEIVARQQAVSELAPKQEIRERMLLRGRLLADSLAGPKAMVAWAEDPEWYEHRGNVRWLTLALPATLIVGLGLLAFGQSVAIPVILLAIAINMLICLTYVGSIHSIFNRVSTRQGEVLQYRGLFQEMVSEPYQSDRLQELHAACAGADHGALSAMTRLGHVMSFASLRHAGLLSILHVILQVTLLWDFHVCYVLDLWKRRHGRYVAQWFDALGQFESLSSLGALLHDNPDWTFPTIEPGGQQVTAKKLGHPLIQEEERVCNDVQVGPPGTVLLVTGSNMSGKSTLLRAIGLNISLAQAGGPVCAKSMSLPTVVMASSMRVRDSLEDGVSFYMAELKRLKEIVDLSDKMSDDRQCKLLYLLDEILQGTNSRERHIAVCRVVAHLVNHQAIGAITTHDLDLATSADLENAVQAVHFRETLQSGTEEIMTFDYQLRQGVATTTNALRLLELVGIRPE